VARDAGGGTRLGGGLAAVHDRIQHEPARPRVHVLDAARATRGAIGFAVAPIDHEAQAHPRVRRRHTRRVDDHPVTLEQGDRALRVHVR
jgi:hypothetical protein